MHSTFISLLLLLIALTFTTALPHRHTRRASPVLTSTIKCAAGSNSPLTHDISAALSTCDAGALFSGACKNVVSAGTVVVSVCPSGTTKPTETTPADLSCAQVAQAVQAIIDGCARSGGDSGSGKGATRAAGEADFEGGLKVFLALRVGTV